MCASARPADTDSAAFADVDRDASSTKTSASSGSRERAEAACDQQQRRAEPQQEPELLFVLVRRERVRGEQSDQPDQERASEHLELPFAEQAEDAYGSHDREERSDDYRQEQRQADEPELRSNLEVRVVDELSWLPDQIGAREVEIRRGEEDAARTQFPAPTPLMGWSRIVRSATAHNDWRFPTLSCDVIVSSATGAV